MFIRYLSLTNFRGINRLELEIPSKLTLLHGENAQGKTSIIEAIHLCAILTSPIASHDRELINFLSLTEEQPFCRIVAGVEKQGNPYRIEIRLIINNNHHGDQRLVKEYYLDGVKRRFFQMVGFFNSVLFLPQMTRIVEDSPDERRKYIDQTLSQAYPGYAQVLVDYNKAVSRRNALLKQLFESKGNEDQLLFWDQLISEKGAAIIHTRKKAVEELSRLLEQQHNDLTDKREQTLLRYLPSFYPQNNELAQETLKGFNTHPPDYPESEIYNHFFNALQSNHPGDIRRGVTTIGPHRDDLGFFSNDIDLRVYGSRGQVRSTVMSLKLAETLWLQQKTGELPVILLDETLAELDKKRRDQLLKVITNGWQAIFTTADIDLFPPEFVQQCTVWKVENGQLVSD